LTKCEKNDKLASNQKNKHMKKIIVVLLATMMIVACKKEIIIPDPTVSISANPTTVDYKGTTVVSWTSSNAKSCSLNGASVATTGSVSVVMTETKTFSITAYGEDGKKANGTVTVTVTLPPAPTLTITGIPTQPLRYWEDSISIPYTTANSVVDSTILNRVKVPNTGTITYKNMVKTANDTLSAFGPGGITTKIITILVGPWTSSEQGLLTGPTLVYIPRGGWQIELLERNNILTGNTWMPPYALTDEDKAERYFWGLDGNENLYNGDDVHIGGPTSYQLIKEDGVLKIKKVGSLITVLELNEHKLVVLSESTIDIAGTIYPTKTRTTFKR